MANFSKNKYFWSYFGQGDLTAIKQKQEKSNGLTQKMTSAKCQSRMWARAFKILRKHTFFFECTGQTRSPIPDPLCPMSAVLNAYTQKQFEPLSNTSGQTEGCRGFKRRCSTGPGDDPVGTHCPPDVGGFIISAYYCLRARLATKEQGSPVASLALAVKR